MVCPLLFARGRPPSVLLQELVAINATQPALAPQYGDRHSWPEKGLTEPFKSKKRSAINLNDDAGAAIRVPRWNIERLCDNSLKRAPRCHRSIDNLPERYESRRTQKDQYETLETD